MKIISHGGWSAQMSDLGNFAKVDLEYDYETDRVSLMIDITIVDMEKIKNSEPFFFKNMSSKDLKKLSSVALELAEAVEKTESVFGEWEDL